MKKYPAVIGATLAGLAGVLTFHTKGTSGSLSASLGTAQAGSAATKQTRGSQPATTPSTSIASKAGGSTSQAQSSQAQSSPAQSSPAQSSQATVAPPPTANSGPRSAVGAAAQYGYGVISVRVTVSGNKITDISVANLQTAESYSQQLANQVIPMLRNEILKAQSLHVYGISGATYTSDAYAQSVQSALTKLHFA
ncbi:MAG: FMN-binding protein [Acidimicrobiales bacterium]